MSQNLLTHLRTYSYKSRLNIKNGAFVMGLISGAFSYFYYRLWLSKKFDHNAGVYKLSLACDNGTPLINMFTQWYRLSYKEYQMTRQFIPYYVMGYIDYEKEILIPRSIKVDGITYPGFDVINPFYCMDDADLHKVFPQFLLAHGKLNKKPGIIKNKVAKRKNSITDPIAKLGKVEVDKLKKMFQAFDQDNDGLLSVKGLARSLFSLKYEFNKEELHSMFSQADTNNTGHINLNEFLTLLANYKETHDQEQQIIAALKVFDSKDQGKIECCQAYKVLKKLDILQQGQIKNILITAEHDEQNWEHQLILTQDLCKTIRQLKRKLRMRENIVYQQDQRVTALNIKQVPVTKQQNAYPTPGALVLNRGWIPYQYRDKLKRSHQVTKKKLVTVFGTFRPGKDIHDYSVPNNAHNNEWYNMALEDIVKFWELPNQYDSKYYYFQAVQIGPQSNGKSIVDADNRQHEFPIPISVDDVISEELNFKFSIQNTKRFYQMFGVFSTMSALLYLIA